MDAAPGGGGGGSGGSGGSGSPSVQVQYDILHLTATQLQAGIKVAEEISGHSQALVGMAEGAGDPSVVSAIESFLGKWAYGLSCLKSDATTLSTALQSAAGKYQRLESTISSAAGGH